MIEISTWDMLRTGRMIAPCRSTKDFCTHVWEQVLKAGDANRPVNILILGGVSAGKTMLAEALAWHYTRPVTIIDDDDSVRSSTVRQQMEGRREPVITCKRLNRGFSGDGQDLLTLHQRSGQFDSCLRADLVINLKRENGNHYARIVKNRWHPDELWDTGDVNITTLYKDDFTRELAIRYHTRPHTGIQRRNTGRR
jgi:hypothetical protein